MRLEACTRMPPLPRLATWLGGATVAALLLAPPLAGTAAAEKVIDRDGLVLQLAGLFQPQALVTGDAAPDGDPSTDFFLRRARLMVYGDLSTRISFFIDAEQVNLGRDGNWDPVFSVEDAFVSLRATHGTSPGLWVDVGMMLIPFTRHSMQSAVSLNGIDYHAALIKYPAGSARAFRDAGVQLRGAIDKLQVRAGVFNGVEGTAANTMTGAAERNTSDVPRVAAHARYALVGEDKGFFYSGIGFTNDTIVSVGAGVDWQRGAIAAGTPMGEPSQHLGLAGDVFAQISTRPGQALVAQATAVRYDDGDAAASTGVGGFVEAGYRVGIVEPLVAFDYFDADHDAGDLQGLHLGGAVFIKQHRTNLKLDAARTKTGEGPIVWAGTLQAQLNF